MHHGVQWDHSMHHGVQWDHSMHRGVDFILGCTFCHKSDYELRASKSTSLFFHTRMKFNRKWGFYTLRKTVKKHVRAVLRFINYLDAKSLSILGFQSGKIWVTHACICARCPHEFASSPCDQALFNVFG